MANTGFGYDPDWSREKATKAGQPWYGDDLQYESTSLEQLSDIQGMLMDNPQLAELYQQAMGGFDPRVTGQLDFMEQLQQDILGGGFFGGAEEQTFRDLISGETLRGQGGTIYDMIQEQFAPARGRSRDYAASMGLAPSSGEAMSMTGNVMGQQDRAFAEQMVNRYLDMIGMGSKGLGQMGGEQLTRQQSAGNIGQWMSQFVESAEQNRMQLGMGITAQQQAPLMQMYQTGQQQRAQKTSGWENLLSAGVELLPLISSLMFPETAAFNAFGSGMTPMGSYGGGGSGTGSGALDFYGSSDALAGY